jgi:hypothetical protein
MNHGDAARFRYKPLWSLELGNNVSYRQWPWRTWDFYRVSGARPCAKLAAFGRERGAALEQKRNMPYLFRVTFTTIPPFT